MTEKKCKNFNFFCKKVWRKKNLSYLCTTENETSSLKYDLIKTADVV